MCVCVCVRERVHLASPEYESMCVCVCERERAHLASWPEYGCLRLYPVSGLPLSHTRTHTLTHTLSQTHTHTLSLNLSPTPGSTARVWLFTPVFFNRSSSLTCTLSHTLSLSYTHSLPHTHLAPWPQSCLCLHPRVVYEDSFTCVS